MNVILLGCFSFFLMVIRTFCALLNNHLTLNMHFLENYFKIISSRFEQTHSQPITSRPRTKPNLFTTRFKAHLSHKDVFLISLEMEQPGRVLLGFHVLESSFSSALPDAKVESISLLDFRQSGYDDWSISLLNCRQSGGLDDWSISFTSQPSTM